MSTIHIRIAQLIMQIDQRVSQQLGQIMYNAKFQELEASWRNVAYLVSQAPYKANVKILLLSINKKEFSLDLLNAIEFDQCQLFDKIYNQGFGIAGGEPFNIIVGNYSFSNNPKDLQVLQLMSQISSTAFAPFISGASAHLFGLNAFTELGKLPDITAIFQQHEYFVWQKLRTQQDTRFLALVLPQHLLRTPYSNVTIGKNFQYHEPIPEKAYLWGNAAFAFAVVLIRSFIQTGWFGNIRGINNEVYDCDGRIPPAINSTHITFSQRLAAPLLTDTFITDSQEKELSEMGFIPLCQQYPGGNTIFYSNSSLQKTAPQTNQQHLISARASSLLQYLLCACRFAHYLKVIMRDQIGSFLSATECENKLNAWLLKYMAANEDLGLAMRAQFPLQNGLVKVYEIPAKPGFYYCQMQLKPFFQLEQLHTEFVFTTNIGAPSL